MAVAASDVSANLEQSCTLPVDTPEALASKVDTIMVQSLHLPRKRARGDALVRAFKGCALDGHELARLGAAAAAKAVEMTGSSDPLPRSIVLQRALQELLKQIDNDGMGSCDASETEVTFAAIPDVRPEAASAATCFGIIGEGKMTCRDLRTALVDYNNSIAECWRVPVTALPMSLAQAGSLASPMSSEVSSGQLPVSRENHQCQKVAVLSWAARLLQHPEKSSCRNPRRIEHFVHAKDRPRLCETGAGKPPASRNASASPIPVPAIRGIGDVQRGVVIDQASRVKVQFSQKKTFASARIESQAVRDGTKVAPGSCKVSACPVPPVVSVGEWPHVCSSNKLQEARQIGVNKVSTTLIATPKALPPAWPAVRSGEVQFILDNPLSFLATRSITSTSMTVGNFRFKILVFPNGTTREPGKYLGAFVLAEPGAVEPDSIFKRVTFEITLVNWVDFRKSKVRSDTFDFKASGTEIDRGWHDFLKVDAMKDRKSQWVGSAGSICIRARCQVTNSSVKWC